MTTMKDIFCSALLLTALGALSACAGDEATPLPTATAAPVATSVRASGQAVAVAQTFVDALIAGDYTEAVKPFDSTMADGMPPDLLQETWETLIKQLGVVQGQGGMRSEKQGASDVVFVTLEFERAVLDAKVVLDSEGQIIGLWFVPPQASSDAPEYVPPAYVTADSFQEEELTVGSGEWPLPGTLTIPGGDGPFPAVVLVHGSGPQDRDETLGPNKPFKDLAWGLASQGIAVLRYEKRTKEHAEKAAALLDTFTVNEETIDDALAAVALLRQTDGIDPERVFVLGHSLGGMLVPRIGANDRDIAGFIVMAGTSRSLEDVVLHQMDYVFGLDGTVTEAEQAILDDVEIQVAQIKELDASDAGSNEVLLGASPTYWLDLRDYAPPRVAAGLERPMLILQGERDYQVTLEDLEGWKQALSSRPDVTLKTYPELNHLFIPGEGAITPAEYEVPGHVAGSVVDDIAEWITQQ
jgi:dienelactone hydrolase